MVRSIEEVLSAEERQKIEEFTSDMRDPSAAWILNKVLHIECAAAGDTVEVNTFRSNRRVHPKKQKPEYADLAKIRRGYLQKPNIRELILTNELRLREHDIRAHKYYLSERAGYDVGLLCAAAHWLREYAKTFYNTSTEQIADGDVVFNWQGLEKAVVVLNHNRQDKEACYVIAFREDAMKEDCLAQIVGGLTRDTLKITERAKLAREQLTKLYTSHHFLILK